MANWTTLKAAIAGVVKTNGNQEITGQLLQNALNNIISSVGENATFAGVATVDTNPGVPDGPVFYLAIDSGVYSNFNSFTLIDEAAVFEWNNGSWSKKVLNITTLALFNRLSSILANMQFLMEKEYVSNPIFEQGAIIGDNGAETSPSDTLYHNYRIRTSNWFQGNGGPIKISIGEKCYVRIAVYNEDKSFSDYVRKGGTIDIKDTIEITTTNGMYYRFILLYRDGANISPFDYIYTDFSILNTEGFTLDDTNSLIGNKKPAYPEQIDEINSILTSQNREVYSIRNIVNNILKIIDLSFYVQNQTVVEWKNGFYYQFNGIEDVAGTWQAAEIMIDVSQIGQSVLLNLECLLAGYCGFKDADGKVLTSFQVDGIKAVPIPENTATMFISNRVASFPSPIIIIGDEWPSKTIKESIYGLFSRFQTVNTEEFLFVQGGIIGSGIEPTQGQEYYSNRLKTEEYLLGLGGNITINFNADIYAARIFYYDSEKTYVHWEQLANKQVYKTTDGYYYRFVIYRNDGKNLTPIEADIADFHITENEGLDLSSLGEVTKYKRPLYEGEISKLPTRNNLVGKRVAFLGDSITQGASASSQENTYHGVFCSLYGAVDRTAEVYAEKGSSSDNLLGMNGTCIANNTKNNLGSKRFVTRATTENFADSKLIVIFGGTNDLSYDRKPIGDLFIEETIEATGNMGTKRIAVPTDTDTFAGALHELITTIQSICPKVPIVLMTPLKRDHNSANNPDYLTCNSNGDFMIDYVNAIKEIGGFYGIPVLDLYSNSNLNPLSPAWSSLFGDGLHPNNEGHKIIGNLLFRFVEENVIVE